MAKSKESKHRRAKKHKSSTEKKSNRSKSKSCNKSKSEKKHKHKSMKSWWKTRKKMTEKQFVSYHMRKQKSQKRAATKIRNKKIKKNLKRIKRWQKSKTKNLSSIKVGQTVQLCKDRVAYVWFKGKVKFGIGIWYGVEIYDAFTTTRHNGTVFGKTYFQCPRNKGMMYSKIFIHYAFAFYTNSGLFVQREIIVSVIKPEDVIGQIIKNFERQQWQRKTCTFTFRNLEENKEICVFDKAIPAMESLYR